MWPVYALGSAFFAGITAILAKIGIRHIDSHLATAIRTGIVFLFSWLLVFLTGAQDGITRLEGGTLLFLVLSGLATGASWLCYFKALQLGDVSRVAPVDKLSTVLTVLLAFVLLGEPVTPLKAVAVLILALGIWLMAMPNEKSGVVPVGKAGWLPLALLSAVFASLTSILGKIGITDVDSNLGTAIRTGVVLGMAWILVFFMGKQREIKTIDRRSWLFLCLSGITTGLSWLCYYRALQEGPASAVVPIDKLSILITVLFAWWFLKEKISRKALLGLICMAVGTLGMTI